jgi:hypothetical protein
MHNKPQLIHHVYFTCAGHFEFLLRSVRSLIALRSEYTGNIYIYVDRDDYFTRAQLIRLPHCSTAILLRKSPRVTGYGRDTINTEIPCLRQVAMENALESYVAKTDSDIIFISGEAFEKVIASEADIAGEAVRHFDPFLFTNGGCYFLKNEAARRLTEVSEAHCAEVLAFLNDVAVRRNRKPEGCPGEDVGVYHLVANKMGGKTVFLSEYRQSIVHVCGTKEEMYGYDNKAFFLIKYKYIPLFRKALRRIYRRTIFHAT